MASSQGAACRRPVAAGTQLVCICALPNICMMPACGKESEMGGARRQSGKHLQSQAVGIDAARGRHNDRIALTEVAAQHALQRPLSGITVSVPALETTCPLRPQTDALTSVSLLMASRRRHPHLAAGTLRCASFRCVDVTVQAR